MKLQIMCSDEMCDRIDLCAKELGMTRSAFCMMLIASGVPKWERDLRVVIDEKNNEFEQISLKE